MVLRMGTLTDLVIAPANQAEAVAAADRVGDQWPTLECRGRSVNSVTLGSLLAIVRQIPWSVTLFDDRLLAARSMEQGPWVTHVPADFVTEVGAIADDQIPSIAQHWAKTDELTRSPVEDLDSFLRDLRDHCRRARDLETSMPPVDEPLRQQPRGRARRRRE